ncbi:MAG: ATP-binding protein [Patescibacteria group bacterium]|nr:ATP-binding protein [Patescibacteria group bacterium]
MGFERDLVSKIRLELENEEISLIVGPRQSGKTTILHQVGGYVKSANISNYFLNLEDPDYLNLLNESPKNLFKIFTINLSERTILFVDEIQYLKDPSNFLKYFFDEYRGKIKIIATGSSAFYMDRKFKDSLVGRKIIFTLLTLSFKEFLRFKGEEDLSKAKFDQLSLDEKGKVIPYYIEYITYGGYPKVVVSSKGKKEEILRDIAYSYIKKDVLESNIKQDEVFYRLMKMLSSQIGNLVNSNEIASTLGVSKTAIENYLYVMQKSFHIGLIPPFYKNVRKELTKMPKVYFVDLGLRNFFRGDFKSIVEREDSGPLLENSVFRQLLETVGKEDIRFWRTTDQKEVDFVVKGKRAYEVKYNLSGVKSSRYQTFLESYPNIKFYFVCFDAKDTVNQNQAVLEPWAL